MLRHVICDVEKRGQLVNAIAPKVLHIMIATESGKEPGIETVNPVRLASESNAAIDKGSLVNCIVC